MPKGSQALTRARKDEIISACAALYETTSFRDITLGDIGARTSFTRTSIYNYFQTKEEIFLALMQREYEAWTEDLESLLHRFACISAESFAGELAHTLEERRCLLKLMSMNHYDLEANTRMENLVAFKRAYGGALQAVRRCLEKFFPSMDTEDVQAFLYAFFPFLFGVYPYTEVTAKQLEAMELAGMHHVHYSVYEITRSLVIRLLGTVPPRAHHTVQKDGKAEQP